MTCADTRAHAGGFFRLLISLTVLYTGQLGAQPAGGVSSTAAQSGAGAVPSTTAPAAGQPAEKPIAELLKDPNTRLVAVPQDFLSGDVKPFEDALGSACVIAGNPPQPARAAIAALAQQQVSSSGRDLPVFVHIVKFDDKNNVANDCWFTVTKTATGHDVSRTTRLYGESGFAVLFVHLERSIPEAWTIDDLKGKVRYYAIVKRKLPQNVLNLLALLRLASIAAAKAQAETKLVSYFGFGYQTGIPRTSDITLLPVDATKDGLLGHKLEVDNEGKHWWDVSVGVPLTKLTGLEYSETASRFDPKEVNKQTIYGLLNIFWPSDLKAPLKWYSYPRILAGGGLTGRPGDRLFVGAGIGIKELQVFAGSGFALFKDPVGPAGQQHIEQRYHSQLTMGINIPVLSAITALTKSNSKTK